MSQASVAGALLAAATLAAFSTRVVAQAEAGHWVSIGPEGGTVLALAVDPSSPSTVYAGCYSSGGGGGIFKTVNGGASWAPSGLSGARIRQNGIGKWNRGQPCASCIIGSPQ
jgi:hypothetical protein